MNLSVTDQVLQTVVWFLAMIELVMAIYILLLNIDHIGNRFLSGLLLLFSLNNLGVGMMLGATDVAASRLPGALLAATVPAMQPALLLIALILLKPEWFLRGRWRFVWWGVGALVVLPGIFTLIDAVFDTGLWYTGVMSGYRGGYVSWQEFVRGDLVFEPLRYLIMYLLPLLSLALLFYLIFKRDQLSSQNRRLAWILVGTLTLVVVVQIALGSLLPVEVRTVLTAFFLVFGYAYAAFKQMISERRMHRGNLQTRLTILIMSIALPIVVAVVMLVGVRTRAIVAQSLSNQLQTLNSVLTTEVASWNSENLLILEAMVTHPAVVSMDPEQQATFLKAIAVTHPQVYLAVTVDPEGQVVAHNDDRTVQNYRNRTWFRNVMGGMPLALDVNQDPDLGGMVWILAMPIRQDGEIRGVGMIGVRLDDLSEKVTAFQVGGAGYAYVIDDLNRALIHSDPEIVTMETNLGTKIPVIELRENGAGFIRFLENQEFWWAYVAELDNGWGVIVQQPQAELLRNVQYLQVTVLVIIAVGVFLLFILAWLTIRQALRPIQSLTQVATAVAAGDLSRTAPVENDDEIGALAHAFNTMTLQVRGLIENLEDRVARRTEELERRADYLAATGAVGHVAASILDVDVLLGRIANLISERFDFYHTGIFLLDERADWAILRAASSEGGREMLRLNHRLKVGEQGIVGYVSSTGKPRIALDVGDDAVWFNNPYLPDTHSEMGLPMIVRNHVIGVLDVQSTEVEAFSSDDVATLQILADQVAVAIENARLFQENQKALRAMQSMYEETARRGWARRSERVIGYRYLPSGTEPIYIGAAQPDVVSAPSLSEDNVLNVPLRAGNSVLGILRMAREAEHPWTRREIEFISQIAADLTQALENARLLTETQERATRNRLVREVSERLRSSTNPDVILQMTIQTLGQVFGAEMTAVEIARAEAKSNDGSEP